MQEVNDKILNKIRNLLSLAQDGKDDEESQTALLMAQKLMLKHKIEQNEIEKGQDAEIILKSLSVYKRLFWWEKLLSKVIANNFRVMSYIQSNRLPIQTGLVKKIVLMGLEEDVQVAYEVYQLAVESMKFHAKKLLNGYKFHDARHRNEVRKAYYSGFIDGLERKFVQQQELLVKENDKYALMIQIPEQVLKQFQDQVGNRKAVFKVPQYEESNLAYSEGYRRGKKTSLTRHFLE